MILGSKPRPLYVLYHWAVSPTFWLLSYFERVLVSSSAGLELLWWGSSTTGFWYSCLNFLGSWVYSPVPLCVLVSFCHLDNPCKWKHLGLFQLTLLDHNPSLRRGTWSQGPWKNIVANSPADSHRVLYSLDYLLGIMWSTAGYASLRQLTINNQGNVLQFWHTSQSDCLVEVPSSLVTLSYMKLTLETNHTLGLNCISPLINCLFDTFANIH